MAKPTIVAAVGSSSPLGRGQRGAMIEMAMSQAVDKASEEARAIWEQTDISQEEKQRRIEAIMNPDAIRARKLAAREDAKKQAALAEAAASSQDKPS